MCLWASRESNGEARAERERESRAAQTQTDGQASTAVRLQISPRRESDTTLVHNQPQHAGRRSRETMCQGSPLPRYRLVLYAGKDRDAHPDRNTHAQRGPPTQGRVFANDGAGRLPVFRVRRQGAEPLERWPLVQGAASPTDHAPPQPIPHSLALPLTVHPAPAPLTPSDALLQPSPRRASSAIGWGRSPTASSTRTAPSRSPSRPQTSGC